jgi:hypothetical protein
VEESDRGLISDNIRHSFGGTEENHDNPRSAFLFVNQLTTLSVAPTTDSNDLMIGK